MTKKPVARSFHVHGQAAGPLEAIEDDKWQRLEGIAQAIRSLGANALTKAHAERLAEQLGINWRTVYRYRQRLHETGETLALRGRARGWIPKHSRLTDVQEAAIEAAIKALRKKPGTLRIVDLVEEVQAHCRIQQIEAPSRAAISRRLKRTVGVRVCRRGVAPAGNADPRISPGSFVVNKPLDVVQIDHTPMDIVVVDDLYRQPLGKPYLTLATDVATRSILGFVISFVPPGAGTVSLCLTAIVAPKADWLQRLGISGQWPMSGLPKSLHLDNAAEFIRHCSAAARSTVSSLSIASARITAAISSGSSVPR